MAIINRKRRKCLGGCDRTFMSESAGNRICGRCAQKLAAKPRGRLFDVKPVNAELLCGSANSGGGGDWRW